MLNIINLQLFAGKAQSTEEQELDYKALYEQMKAEAEQNKALAEKLQAEATERVGSHAAEDVSSVEEYLEQRVPIMLFKDADKYKDDVTIAINGERIQIQRGIQVYVKRKYLSVIENQYRQQMIAAEMQDELAEEFASGSRARGINI